MSVVTRIRMSEELMVPFTPEEVWSVLADVAAYPGWWPAILGVEVLRNPGELIGAEFEVRPFLGRRFRIRFEELEGHHSVRLRFFGGTLEGPGGFHLREAGGATQVRYEMDVFTRGMKIAVLSQFLPYGWIHRSRMRSVLRRLARRLKAVRAAAKRVTRPRQEAAAPPAATAAPTTAVSNFETARRYLEALSSNAKGEGIAPFLSPAALQEEFPHRFLEVPVIRSYDAILEARGRAVTRFSSQRFELAAATGGGAQVAMEIRWKGTVAATDESHKEGQELDARLAMFLKFGEGRIVRERIYACFEPWSTAAERRTVLDERVAQAARSSPVSSPAALLSPIAGANFDIARAYLEELGSRKDAEDIARFFNPAVMEEEFPNASLPGGAHRDLQAIKLARSRSLALLSSQNYELLGATGGGSMVALETAWTGVVGEGAGQFTSGQRLEARVAIFLKFHEGRIVAQRSYRCAYNSPSVHGADAEGGSAT